MSGSGTLKIPATRNRLTTGQLPRFASLYTLGVAFVLAAAVMGLIGFNAFGLAAFTSVFYLILISALSTAIENRRKAMDRFVRGLVTVAFLLALAPLVSTLWTVFSKGIGIISPAFVFTSGGSPTINPNTLEIVSSPGALQAIVGTLEITGLATLFSVPIGLLTAIYLVEYAAPTFWLRRVVNFLVDVMTGIPSIVAGLFAFSLFSLLVGPKAFSGLSAAVALSVLMIPTVVRSSEEMLRLVPADLREASYALGVTKYVTIMRIVVPTAIAGLATGVTLAIARVIGETAPIFMAASFTDAFNGNPLNGPMQTLPVMAYTGYKFPGQDIALSNDQAWGAALLLVALVIVLNLIARIIAMIFAPKTGR
ncbi:phosphate ABC transporter permease PstA [Paenarthrobacter sp. Z7-10]|uniref:phosphate ABC transporter permease PstA n=1 Tax=Paenarthrobacter sp. Z7-10 TaxID=2787635 RepID=UPI0022A9BCBF|nr:phosphate ABC transporter permease PstA [Paenarthrobacter sp. Z7-10]MCZ2401984.1 phosphate ABC transporter permease PstA [Paenarthrobacter sp. Z7-10]